MRGGKGAGPDCTCGETEAQWQQNTAGGKLMLWVSYLKHDVATRSFFGANLKPAVNKLPDLQFCSISFSLDCNGFLWHTEAIQRSVLCFSYTTREHSFSPWSPGSCHCLSVCSRNQAHANDDFGINSPSIWRALLLIRGFCVLFGKKKMVKTLPGLLAEDLCDREHIHPFGFYQRLLHRVPLKCI